MIPSILEQILMLWHNIRHSAKEIKHFDEIWPSLLTTAVFNGNLWEFQWGNGPILNIV